MNAEEYLTKSLEHKILMFIYQICNSYTFNSYKDFKVFNGYRIHKKSKSKTHYTTSLYIIFNENNNTMEIRVMKNTAELSFFISCDNIINNFNRSIKWLDKNLNNIREINVNKVKIDNYLN